MRGGEVCTLRKGEKGNCVGGANMCWHIGGMALKIRWDVRGEDFTYSRFLTDEREVGGSFSVLSSGGSDIRPQNLTLSKQKAPHTQRLVRQTEAGCVCVWDLALTHVCLC